MRVAWRRSSGEASVFRRALDTENTDTADMFPPFFSFSFEWETSIPFELIFDRWHDFEKTSARFCSTQNLHTNLLLYIYSFGIHVRKKTVSDVHRSEIADLEQHVSAATQTRKANLLHASRVRLQWVPNALVAAPNDTKIKIYLLYPPHPVKQPSQFLVRLGSKK